MVPKTEHLTNGVDPRRMLRRRSSLVVADLPVYPHPVDGHIGAQKQPQASVFEEPEPSSLLDSFGF
jgi:hypothetical protein